MNNFIKELKKDSQGQTIIMALVLLVVGALICTPFLYLASTTIKAVRISERNVNAFYAADAGIEFGLYRLIQDSSYDGDLAENVNGMLVTIDTEPGTTADFEITAEARLSGQLISQVKACVERSGFGPPYEVTVEEWEVLK